jgi:hypothetical protein
VSTERSGGRRAGVVSPTNRRTASERTGTDINPGGLPGAVPTVYYVTVNGNRVAGPFESRKEAKREADTRSTNEVNLTYGVESVRE